MLFENQNQIFISKLFTLFFLKNSDRISPNTPPKPMITKNKINPDEKSP